MVGGLHLLHSRRDIIAAFWQGSELIGCRAEVARESRRRGWCVFGTSSPCGGTLDARPHLPAESSDGEAVVQSRRPERGENHRPPRPSGWARSANLPTASPRWLLTSATWRPSPAARREAPAQPVPAASLFGGLEQREEQVASFFSGRPHEGFSCFFDEILLNSCTENPSHPSV